MGFQLGVMIILPLRSINRFIASGQEKSSGGAPNIRIFEQNLLVKNTIFHKIFIAYSCLRLHGKNVTCSSFEFDN